MIGAVFGLTESRVTYFGPMMSIYCLVLAFLSGIAFYLFYDRLNTRVIGKDISEEKAGIINEFARIFSFSCAIS